MPNVPDHAHDLRYWRRADADYRFGLRLQDNTWEGNNYFTGNVGIGTTSPTKDLTVAGANAIPVVRLIRNDSGSISDGNVIGEIHFDATDSDTLESTVDAMGVIRTIARASIASGNKQSDMAFLVKGLSGNYDASDIEVMRLTYGGNVGINTTSPSALFHVHGTPNYDPSVTHDAGAGVILESGTVQLASGASSSSPYPYWLQSRALGGAWPLALNPLGGNVGIGTTSPAALLDIWGGAGVDGIRLYVDSVADTPKVHFRNSGGTDSYIWQDSSGNLNFSTENAASGVVMERYGKVGIGTTSPLQTLSVYNANGGLLALDAPANKQTDLFFYSAGAVKFALYRPISSNDLRFWSAGYGDVLSMVYSTANVGIGTTAPTSKLQVVGLPSYANNAAAVSGGLTAGAFYLETGTNPLRVCCVY